MYWLVFGFVFVIVGIGSCYVLVQASLTWSSFSFWLSLLVLAICCSFLANFLISLCETVFAIILRNSPLAFALLIFTSTSTSQLALIFGHICYLLYSFYTYVGCSLQFIIYYFMFLLCSYQFVSARDPSVSLGFVFMFLIVCYSCNSGHFSYQSLPLIVCYCL